MRLLSKQWTQRDITPNTDEVLCWVPLPDGARVNNLWLESHIISARMAENDALIYGMAGEISRKVDPDNYITYDAEWDMVVAKDQDMATSDTAMYNVMTTDTMSSVVTPADQPGFMNVENLFTRDLDGSQNFFERRKMLTVVNSGRNFNSGDSTVMLTDLVHTRVRFGSKYKIRGMHTAMVGFSNPDLTNTTTAVSDTPTNDEWLILSYIDDFIDEMLAYAIGIADSNTSDPYQQVSVFIADLLEGRIVEDTSASFVNQTYRVFTKATWDITLPGRQKITTLSS